MTKGKAKAMPKVRRPYVAGTFYKGNAESLRKQIEKCFLHSFGPQKIPEVTPNATEEIIGLICPHAGYDYSGPIAANAYYELAESSKPETVVILGPNHTGYGSAIDMMIEGTWSTPLGDIKIDEEIANRILKETRFVDVNEIAHRFEHSIEVQLPFLQYLYGDEFKFVPIAFSLQDLKSATEIGKALVEVLVNEKALVIASSDLTHYEPQAAADLKDRAVLEAVRRMDEELLFETIQRKNISACGYGPIASLVKFAKLAGCKEAKILAHKTSGDIINDYSSVVGYAAVCFKK